MQIRITQDAPLGVRTEALVVPIFEDTALEGLSKDVDAAAGGAIGEALASGEIKGKLGETVLAYAKEQPFRRVLAIGLGESAKFEIRCSPAMPRLLCVTWEGGTSRRSPSRCLHGYAEAKSQPVRSLPRARWPDRLRRPCIKGRRTRKSLSPKSTW